MYSSSCECMYGQTYPDPAGKDMPMGKRVCESPPDNITEEIMAVVRKPSSMIRNVLCIRSGYLCRVCRAAACGSASCG